jgi:uncharacterized protein with FMN-binding domain
MTSQTFGSIRPPIESVWRRLGRLVISAAVLSGSAAYVWTYNPELFRPAAPPATAEVDVDDAPPPVAVATSPPTPAAAIETDDVPAPMAALPTPSAPAPADPASTNPNPLARATGSRIAEAGQPIPGSAVVAAGPLPTYHDGNFRGNNAYAYFGEVAVRAVVENGKLIDVKVMRYPNHRKISKDISDPALVVLRRQALERQSAAVDMVSGATWTSKGYAESLSKALALSVQ